MTTRKLLRSCGFVTLVISAATAGCAPYAGPDKSVAGAVLGAGWGAGTGAIIGNQVNDTGPGAAIGAGIGAASGLLTGIGMDLMEGTALEQQRQLDSLTVQVAANTRMLAALRGNLDDRGRQLSQTSTTAEIFFDPNLASLRTGSAEQLERFALAIKQNPYVGHIEIHGHSDDAGASDQNQKLSEARARTVATFLSNQGISFHQMSIQGHGAMFPLTSNDSESGRQFNRRVEIVLKK